MNNFFISSVSEKEIKAEKLKARELRSKEWWKTLINQGVCYYCHEKFSKDQLTMDHVVPIIRGGKSTKGNIVCCCKECNNKKKYYLPIEMNGELDS